MDAVLKQEVRGQNVRDRNTDGFMLQINENKYLVEKQEAAQRRIQRLDRGSWKLDAGNCIHKLDSSPSVQEKRDVLEK